MADIRINSLPSTATSFNTDDYIAIDGASGGTRKMLAATLPLTDVTLGGTSGPSVKSTLSARAPRQGLVFDGTDQASVTLPTLGTSDWTFAAWINSTTLADRAIIGANSNTGTDRLGVLVTPSGTINFNSGSTTNLTSTGTISAGKSTLITAYRNGNSIFVSINGGTPENIGSCASLNITNTAALIGKWSNNFPLIFVGTISGALIYNRALSASEVVALYEAGAPAGADYNNAGQTLPITGYNLSGVTNLGGGVYQFTASGNIFSTTSVVKKGKQYTAVFNVDAISGAVVIIWNGTGFTNTGITTTGLKSFTYTALADSTFGMLASGGTMTISAIAPYGLGLLLAPDAAQAGGGLVWYDTSGNAANITLPASGVSWNVPSSRVLGGNWTTSGNLTVSGRDLTLGSSESVIYFGTPSSNYLYYNGSSLFLRVGSVDRITIPASTGNFLIGTTTDGGQKLQVNGTATISGALSIGNTVQTAASVASTHKVTISIGGSTYYLLATNV